MVVAGVTLSLVSARADAARRASESFASPEDAVRALIEAVKAGTTQDLVAIFGPDSKDLVDSSDPATARRNREVFTVAVAERWHLVDQGTDARCSSSATRNGRFRCRSAKDGSGWRFDTAAGKEEVLDRRIGRNELAVIRICAHVRRGTAALCRTGATMDSRRDCMPGHSRAIRVGRMVSIGRPRPVGSAVRSVTSSRKPPKKAGLLVKMARSRHRFTATTSGF